MDVFDDGIWMPCLGRNLQLGTLYDCCTDDIVIGSSIWDEKTIHEAKVENASKHSQIECTVCTPHNISNKASCLGINEELYLSCTAGRIKLEGEAKFFNDNVPSKNVIRVALKCYSSSKVIQLNKSKLNSVNIETFEQDNATHVITAIEYGTISIIVLYQKIHDKSGIIATDENLKTKANYLQRCITGNCPKMFDMENNTGNITCRVYSTLHITHKKETYADAVKFCEDLFKLHTDHSTHKPIKVFLSPLKKIKKNFTKHARNINDSALIDRVKYIHDIIIDIALDIKDIKANIGTAMLPCITKQTESISNSSDKLQSDFVKILGCMIPKYRKGDIEKSSIEQTIKGLIEECENLYSFVQNKLKEVHQICTFMKALKDYDLIPEASEVFFNYKYIICLEFNICRIVDFEMPANISPWYQDRKIIAEVRYKIKQFLKFAKENSSNEGIKFGIREFTDKKCSELVMICLYDDSTEIFRFEPPTPPGKPVESQKSESSITLTWSEPQNGAQFINSYCVYFSEADDSKWIPCPTVKCTNNNTAIIKELEANTKYLFKVSATTKIHTTIESQMSEAICTADHESSESKSDSKKVSSKPTQSNNTSDGQVIPANNKTNTAHSYNKGATTTCTSNQRQDSKAPESDIAPQATEVCPQDAVNKGAGKDSTTHTPTNNVKPKGSILQHLYEKNKCERLKASSPSIYKLNVTNVYMQHIESELFNFGKRNEQLPEKVILLVGATGAGKSTLINGMVNYIFGVEWDDLERVVLIGNPTEKKTASQAVSQTTSVNIYKINHSKYDRLSYNLTIIDTPGFADTDGPSKDQTIMVKIQTLLTSHKVIDHIDIIGFVVQAPLSRLTPTQSYVINSVYSLFGRDVANNICVLATFSDPVSPPHVKSALDEANIQYNDEMFKFNNSALYAKTIKHDKILLNKLLWEMGMESFNTFFRELKNIDPVSLTLTKDLLNERKKLQILLEGLQTQINNEFMNMQKLECEEKLLRKCKNEIEKNENFQYQAPVIHTEMVQLTSQHELATNCRQCKMTCHKNCYESRYNGRCYMMVSSFPYGTYCDICKCSMNTHITLNSIYWTHYGTETKTFKKMKQKYDKAQNAQIDIEKIIRDINDELEKVRKGAREKLSEIHKCIQKINKISLQPNLITEVDYIRSLIASERSEQTEGYTTRLTFYDKILKELALESQV